jgi:uncharacterized protein with PQ loop repeat
VNLVMNLLIAVASLLGSGMAVPQARRLVRTRRVEGISAVWIGVSVAINGWWLTYGIVTGLWAIVPVSLVSLLVYVVMAVVFVSAVGRRSLPGLVLGSFGLGMAPLPFLLAGGWGLAGVAIGLSYGIQLLPAVVVACRTHELAGISPTTWLIAWVEALLWLAIGWRVADAALIIAGFLGVAMATTIVARLAVTGHRPMEAFASVRRFATAQ